MTFETTLESITDAINQGDCIYIHYSGHGTGNSTTKGVLNDDVALVLLDEDQKSEYYYWTAQLAERLNRMIQKGAAVTLVLDCCYSGAVQRHSSLDRWLPYDPKLDLRTADDHQQGLAVRNTAIFRDASMQMNWKLDAERYTILTACGPHQRAKSFRNKEDNIHYGVLSYYLYETLATIGLSASHITIHKRVLHRILNCLPSQQQSPMLYGNTMQTFFGQSKIDRSNGSIGIIRTSAGLFRLSGGYAHGLSLDDELTVASARDLAGLDESNSPHFEARIIEIEGLTSRLEIADRGPAEVRSGWLVIPRRRSCLAAVKIHLSQDLDDCQDWIEMLAERSLTARIGDHQAADTLNLDIVGNHYKVSDNKSCTLPNLPVLTYGHTDRKHVCDILEHLAQFHMVQKLDNSGPSCYFLPDVLVSVSHDTNTYNNDDLILIKHLDVIEISVQNNGSFPVYVSVLDLGPQWQVEDVYRGSWFVVQGNSTRSEEVEIAIPPELLDAGQSCKETIKVLVTSEPTSFDMLELPRINQALQQKINETLRGEHISRNLWTIATFHFELHV